MFRLFVVQIAGHFHYLNFFAGGIWRPPRAADVEPAVGPDLADAIAI